MMKKISLAGQALMIFLFLFAVSCKKDESPNPTPPTPETMVSAQVSGFIVDQNDDPIQNAEVSLEGTNVMTDAYGAFHFSAMTVPANRAFVKASKAGFFHASKTLTVGEGSALDIRIKMIDKGSPTSVMATSGGMVNHSSGASIDFPANGIVDASGAAYGGEVWVYAYHLDPTLDDVYERMPGDLVGVDNSGTDQFLSSYGMMAVELSTPSGDPLQVATGSPATLSMPVPASILGSAPASIPLWSFNEETGRWVEEGSATLQGGEYVGQVEHFSWWNCDFPAGPRIKLQGQLVDTSGQPMVGYYVRITLVNSWGGGGGVTDTSGTFCGPVPANQALKLVVRNRCGGILYSQNIGPFSSATNLGTLIVQPSFGMIRIDGTLEDCSGNPIAGYIRIGNAGRSAQYYNVNGAFSISFNGCASQTYLVTGVDPVNMVMSNGVSVIATSPVINVGALAACTVINHYVTFDMNGATYNLNDNVAASDSSGTGYLSVTATDMNNTWFNMWATGTGIGVHPNSGFSLNQQPYTPNGITITVTSYSGVGQDVGGTFSGTFVAGGTTYVVTNGQFNAPLQW